MPIVAASVSPEWTSPSESRRSSVKARGGSTKWRARHALCFQYSTPDLILLDGFEQRAEIAFTESLVALALDDLEEDRADDRLRENLQQHFILGGIAVGRSRGPVLGRGCDPGGDRGTANRFGCH